MRTDELWCNGSTTDSDSVCLGSNPGSSTKVPLLRGAFFCYGRGLVECSKMPLVVRDFEKTAFFTSKSRKMLGNLRNFVYKLSEVGAELVLFSVF